LLEKIEGASISSVTIKKATKSQWAGASRIHWGIRDPRGEERISSRWIQAQVFDLGHPQEPLRLTRILR
jgi:hypothetical protein